MASTTANMSLVKWDDTADFFNHAQLAANFQAIDTHDHTSGKGAQVQYGGLGALTVGSNELRADAVTTVKVLDNAITTPKLADGSVTVGKIASGGIPAAKLATGVTFTGSCQVTGSDTRSNAAFSTLSTPDQVTNVVLPANGLIAVWYQAVWQSSVGGAGGAAVFVGANQIKIANPGNATPIVQSAQTSSTAATDMPLATFSNGLASGSSATGYVADVTTGQILGVSGVGGAAQSGPCWLFASAGTYTVSVQYAASSGSVTAKQRTLRVLALTF